MLFSITRLLVFAKLTPMGLNGRLSDTKKYTFDVILRVVGSHGDYYEKKPFFAKFEFFMSLYKTIIIVNSFTL